MSDDFWGNNKKKKVPTSTTQPQQVQPAQQPQQSIEQFIQQNSDISQQQQQYPPPQYLQPPPQFLQQPDQQQSPPLQTLLQNQPQLASPYSQSTDYQLNNPVVESHSNGYTPIQQAPLSTPSLNVDAILQNGLHINGSFNVGNDINALNNNNNRQPKKSSSEISSNSPQSPIDKLVSTVKGVFNKKQKGKPAVVEPQLVKIEDSAEQRTSQIELDVVTYQKYGGIHACNSTVLFHMMDRWLTTIRTGFFSRNIQFHTKYQHMYKGGELEVDSLKEVEYLGNCKISFLESSTQWDQGLEQLQSKLTKAIPSERKKLVDEAIHLCMTVLEEFKNLAHRDPKYRVDLANLDAFLNELYIRNSKNEYFIPVVGLEKAGKTSTLNATFGFDLLPSALARCTLVVTRIRSSQSSRFEALVQYRTEDELAEFLSDPALKLDRDKIQALKNECKPLYGKTYPKTTDNPREIRQFIEEHVSDHRMQYVVKHIDISVPHLTIGGNNVTFIDTPGSDAAIRAHEKITAQVLMEADACLYVKRGTLPSDNLASKQLSEKLQRPTAVLYGNNNNEEQPVLNNRPDPDFTELPKSKVFVVLTHLDMRAANRIREAIQLCKGELTKNGFKDDHIIPADPRYSLFSQQPESLNESERGELLDYENSVAFKQSGLGEGIKELKHKLEYFIESELPFIRARDARNCIVEVRKLLGNCRAQLARDIPNKGSFEVEIENQKDEHIKKIWDEKILVSRESANEWIFYEFLNKKEKLTTEWALLFKNLFNSTFNTPEARAYPLKTQIPKNLSHMFLINLDPIEDAERVRLVEFHLTSLRNACESLASSLWQLLQQFADKLTSSLGEGLDFGWRIQDCIDFSVCLHEVESQIMRVIYPLVYATLRWPIRHEHRTHSIEELHTAVPEIFYSQEMVGLDGEEEETGVLRIPKGVQGVLKVAVDLGFLPGAVGAVAHAFI